MKKVIIGLFTFVLIIAMVFYIEPSWSDSGFDTSYGGSSGSSHSSSHSSSRSRSSSSSSSSSSSHSSSSRSSSSNGELNIDKYDIISIIMMFICLACGLTAIGVFINQEINKKKPIFNDNYGDMDINKLQAILPNETLDSLKEMAVNKFIEIQNAWMNFDYETLKKCCSDELYNSYYEQLEVLKAKNQKNIMSDFQTISIKIINCGESTDYINVRVFLKIAFYDYVVDGKGKVLHGNKKSKIMNNYVLNFIRAKDTSARFCSSCGAEITDPAAKVCPYCRSKIVVPPSQFVLSKKVNDQTIVL
ncbi:MAG: TIM44-like domain-containing protein [Bacilli bacterium]|nr:TIM44-like domain-containing protein [Bacilli bacterium]